MRIAVLGLNHDHVWDHLPQVADCDGIELVAGADAREPLRAKLHEQYGVPVHADWQACLDQHPVDAVYVFADNRTGVEIAVGAAARGLHLLIEKPLAQNLEGAQRVAAAARQHDVRVMVNWPFAWWPQLQHALRLIDEGDIGRVWQIKYRAAHAGPREMGCSEWFCEWLFDAEQNGGGALIDYCCYGALLAQVVLGSPNRVTGVRGGLCKEELSVEDNAILLMTYPNAWAISEASWTEVGNLSAYRPLFCGTEATLLVEPRVGGRLLKATSEQPDGLAVELPAAGEHLRSATAHFAHGISSGSPFQPLCRLDHAVEVQRLLAAGMELPPQS